MGASAGENPLHRHLPGAQVAVFYELGENIFMWLGFLFEHLKVLAENIFYKVGVFLMAVALFLPATLNI